MMYASRDANTKMCPVRQFSAIPDPRSGRGMSFENDVCHGSSCPMWRFGLTPNSLVVAAIQRAMKETGEPALKHTEAARLVANDPAKYGLPVGEERMGWCGMGGKPEVAA